MRFLPLSVVLAVGSVAVTAGYSPKTSTPATAEVGPDTGLVTLFAQDDLRSSFSFSAGGCTATIVGGELSLLGSQLVFHRLAPNQLSFGFDRHQRAQVLDLGAEVIDPVQRATDDVIKPAVSIFHTLFLDGSVFFYRGPAGRLRRLSGFGNFANGAMTEGVAHLEPEVGHTYVFRYKDEVGYGKRDALVKFQVIEFLPDNRLTFRWAPL